MKNRVIRFAIQPLMLIGIMLAAVPATPACAAAEEESCPACHFTKAGPGRYVDPVAHAASIHGKHRCSSCHADAVETPHPAKLAPVRCANCHRVETQLYLASDHGKAVAAGQTEAAACKDCHGATHQLLNSRNPKSPVNRSNIAGTCARCHEDESRMSRFRLSERHPLQSYNHSVHGQAFAAGKKQAAVCTDCHGSHDLHGAANSASRVFWKNVPGTCAKCHQNVAAVYHESIHGQAAAQGVKEAPVCTSCHGEHTILPMTDRASSVWRGAVTKTCAGCHAMERMNARFGLPADRLTSYLDTYHGLAAKRGDLRVANCASCHGFHDVLPSTDPRSSIHKANLANTCGRCHPGAGERLATGWIHGAPAGKHWTLTVAKWFYLFVIPLTLGGMLLHNGADLLRKAGASAAKPHNEFRLTAAERAQHAVLVASFIMLAYSGFALEYPDAIWTALIAPFSEEIRRSLHRWAAAVFCALGLVHLGTLIWTARGRETVRALVPSWADLAELRGRLGFLAGRAPAAPRPAGRFGYMEKVEYWSLVWGSIVMVVTGALLIFNNLVLKYLAAWVPDLATLVHFWEAVLACLAIVVWHWYSVIFDPEVYPMNRAWLTGWIRGRPPR